VTKADGTEIPFNDVEGMCQNDDLSWKLNRKTQDPPEKVVVPSKRKKTTPKHKHRSKSIRFATDTGGRSEKETTKSPEQHIATSPTAGAKTPSGDAAANKVTPPPGDERIKDLERHLRPFFILSPAYEVAHS
jgi:hypothetical protein